MNETLKACQSCLFFELVTCDFFERTNCGQDWCRCLGVIKDQDGAAAVTAIKALPHTQVAVLQTQPSCFQKSSAITKGGTGQECYCIKWVGFATLQGHAGWSLFPAIHSSTRRNQDA